MKRKRVEKIMLGGVGRILAYMLIVLLITFITGKYCRHKSKNIIQDALKTDRKNVVAETVAEQDSLDVINSVRKMMEDKYIKIIGEKVQSAGTDFTSMRESFSREIYDTILHDKRKVTEKGRKIISKENFLEGKIGTIFCLLVASATNKRPNQNMIRKAEKLNVDFIHWFNELEKTAMIKACDEIKDFYLRAPATIYWYSRLQMELGPSVEQVNRLLEEFKITGSEAEIFAYGHNLLEGMKEWAKSEMENYLSETEMEMDGYPDEEIEELAEFVNNIWYDFDEFPYTMVR